MSRLSTLLLASLLLTATVALAAKDPVESGVESLRKHRYGEAIRLLEQALPGLPPSRQGAARLGLGMACLEEARLHGRLQLAARLVQRDYLQKLAATKGKERGNRVDLFLAEALLDAGAYREAADRFRRFVAAQGIGSEERDLARVGLGLALHFQGDKAGAEASWKAVRSTSPEVGAELACAYLRAGLKSRDPLALFEKALAAAGPRPSPRLVKAGAFIYAASAAPEKGLALAARGDLGAPAAEERPGTHKLLRFYDIALYEGLSRLYAAAAAGHLKKAREDAATREAAGFYLGQALAFSGAFAEASTVTSETLSAARLPKPLLDRARVLESSLAYRQGKKGDALRGWEDLARRQPPVPELLAEVLLACGDVGADCAEAQTRGILLAEAVQGRRLPELSLALGGGALSRGDLPGALRHLEAGRDKSNKNRIEFNDPLLLTLLVEGYYRTLQYSEALEILFAMSSEFPAVRQLQEALQGVYSMEQKSAGDVKIL